MIKLEDLLMEMVERGSSDLFLKAGSPPNLRLDGQGVISGTIHNQESCTDPELSCPKGAAWGHPGVIQAT